MKNILLILTGGTLASVDVGKGLEPILDAEQILRYLPEGLCKKLDCEMSVEQIYNIESPDIKPEQWISLSKLIYDNYEIYDGFVIIHGTDTLAYTSSALSYLLQNLKKPVIITGSQIPIEMENNDAVKNLEDSIIVSCDSKFKGVFVVFNGKIMFGNHITKYNSKTYDAFKSINYVDAGVIADGQIDYYHLSQDNQNAIKMYDKLNANILLIKIFPGIIPEDILKFYESYSAIILEGFGVAGIPKSFIEIIMNISDKSIPIVFISHVLNEGTDLSRYTVGNYLLRNSKIIESGTLTFEATLTKIMYSLGRSKNYEEFKKYFMESIQDDL